MDSETTSPRSIWDTGAFLKPDVCIFAEECTWLSSWVWFEVDIRKGQLYERHVMPTFFPSGCHQRHPNNNAHARDSFFSINATVNMSFKWEDLQREIQRQKDEERIQRQARKLNEVNNFFAPHNNEEPAETISSNWETLKAKLDSKSGDALLDELEKVYRHRRNELGKSITQILEAEAKRPGLWPKGESVIDKFNRFEKEMAEDEKRMERAFETARINKLHFLLPTRAYLLQRHEYKCLLFTQAAIIQNGMFIHRSKILLYFLRVRKR
jgi:hypothetical protein